MLVAVHLRSLFLNISLIESPGVSRTVLEQIEAARFVRRRIGGGGVQGTAVMEGDVAGLELNGGDALGVEVGIGDGADKNVILIVVVKALGGNVSPGGGCDSAVFGFVSIREEARIQPGVHRHQHPSTSGQVPI